jgi:hypothetical protein
MSYLTRNGELVATTSRNLKSGDVVSVAHTSTDESINADRDINLVNAFNVTVSNAKRWARKECDYTAVSVNDSLDEFLLV